jgi:hypothetical protein
MASATVLDRVFNACGELQAKYNGSIKLTQVLGPNIECLDTEFALYRKENMEKGRLAKKKHLEACAALGIEQ